MTTQTANGTTWADVEDYFGYEFILFCRYKENFQGQRKGQAFMNTLIQMGFDEEHRVLTGSLVDPFYRHTLDDVLIAFEYILTTKV